MWFKLKFKFSDENRVFVATSLQMCSLFENINETSEINTSYDHEPRYEGLEITDITENEYNVLPKHGTDCNVWLTTDEDQVSIEELLNN